MARFAVAANPKREASCHGLGQVAVDVHVMPEARAQQSRNLADGNARLRNLELDLVGPGPRQAEGCGRTARGILQMRELVEQRAGTSTGA